MSFAGEKFDLLLELATTVSSDGAGTTTFVSVVEVPLIIARPLPNSSASFPATRGLIPLPFGGCSSIGILPFMSSIAILGGVALPGTIRPSNPLGQCESLWVVLS